MEKEKIRQAEGITLIALVVTIVILIILATISVNIVLNSGLVSRIQSGKEMHELEREKERLEMVKGDVASNTNHVGKVTVDTYVEELINQGITVSEEVTDNGDGSKTVITDTGYSVLIEPNGEKDVKITIDGKEGALPPRIIDVKLRREGTTIRVDVEAIRTEGATYKYYYKTEGGEYQLKPVNSENVGTYTITGIDKNNVYVIKVELSNEYGISTKEVDDKNCKPIVIYKGGKLVEESIITEHEKIEGEDRLGNKVVVPKGFMTTKDTGETVQEGIVIEDDEGNQFVWIPVSNINHNGTGKIIRNDGSKVEITLGRYTFNTSTGKETKVQYGSEYATTTVANVKAGTVSQYQAEDGFFELTDSRISNNSTGKDGTNTTAKNLQAFIESVRDNHGYYLARYEASHSIIDSSKPASKIANVWGNVKQSVAATASRKMYEGNTKVEAESDLCNSYGWDTTIVYIQAMGHNNYANASKNTTGNQKLLKTGETGDEVCKIFDMAANCNEWTTEYSTAVDSANARCCTYRGDGRFRDYTSSRSNNPMFTLGSDGSFRVLLYM